MANTCYNTVKFQSVQMDLLREHIEQITIHSNRYSSFFIENEAGWLMDVEWKGDELHFRTDWQPQPEVIKQMADLYEADFLYQYDEVQNFVQGSYEYTGGRLKHFKQFVM